MVALSAAAVIENARAAVSVAHSLEAGSDLVNRGIPIDFLERSVGAAPKRRRQPVLAVLVVVDPLRLLAGVAVRRDVLAIPTHASDTAPVELHFDSAVHTAQD